MTRESNVRLWQVMAVVIIQAGWRAPAGGSWPVSVQRGSAVGAGLGAQDHNSVGVVGDGACGSPFLGQKGEEGARRTCSVGMNRQMRTALAWLNGQVVVRKRAKYGIEDRQ